MKLTNNEEIWPGDIYRLRLVGDYLDGVTIEVVENDFPNGMVEVKYLSGPHKGETDTLAWNELEHVPPLEGLARVSE